MYIKTCILCIFSIFIFSVLQKYYFNVPTMLLSVLIKSRKKVVAHPFPTVWCKWNRGVSVEYLLVYIGSSGGSKIKNYSTSLCKFFGHSFSRGRFFRNLMFGDPFSWGFFFQGSFSGDFSRVHFFGDFFHVLFYSALDSALRSLENSDTGFVIN